MIYSRTLYSWPQHLVERRHASFEQLNTGFLKSTALPANTSYTAVYILSMRSRDPGIYEHCTELRGYGHVTTFI
jgi:hypothetical protein